GMEGRTAGRRPLWRHARPRLLRGKHVRARTRRLQDLPRPPRPAAAGARLRAPRHTIHHRPSQALRGHRRAAGALREAARRCLARFRGVLTMANRLLLMRHAKAQWPSPGASDFDRPLTEIGIGEARSMGEMMQAAGLRPDRVLCSGARRCRETWQELSFLFDVAEVEYDDTLYACDAAGYLDLVRLHGTDGTLLLIGHNPMTEELAMALTSDRTGS